MPTAAPPKRPPLVLLASDQEWSNRSLATILGPGGYVVTHAYTARTTMEQARRNHPAAILLDVHLPERDGLDVCRALRQDPLVGPSTPILMLAVGPPTKRQRLAALRAGAWDVLSLPVDAEELLLKLDGYVRAEVEVDRAREEGLVDLATGLYNVRGLARRAREISSEARRHHTAVACVVFGPDADRGEPADQTRVSDGIAPVVQRTGRVSDAIGLLGGGEFAIIAPTTDAPAAVRLAQRMISALRETLGGSHDRQTPLRAGYEAVEDLHATPVAPVDLLVRATTALEHARSDGNGERIRRYVPPAATDPASPRP